MNNIILILIFLVILITLSILWVMNIDFMSSNHPDYKGNDLFGDFDEDDKNSIL